MKTSKFYTRATPLRTRNENILENLNIFFHLLTLCWGDNDWCVDYGVCLHRTLQCKYWSHGHERHWAPLSIYHCSSSSPHGSQSASPASLPRPAARLSRVTCHASRVTWLVTQLLNHLHGRVSTLFVAETGRCELWRYSVLVGRTRSCSPIPGQRVQCWSLLGHCVTVSGCGEMADSGRWMLDIYIGKW